MNITIPRILQDRFATKRRQQASEQARLNAEADAQRADEIKTEDRQRQLIAATVDENTVSAKDADWLAERYESDLDYQRDAESYQTLKAATARMTEAAHHDQIVQACKNRLVEIDELIGESKYDLSTRIVSKTETVKGPLLLEREAADLSLGKHAADHSLDFSIVKAALEVKVKFATLNFEREFLLSKVNAHERKRKVLISKHEELIKPDNQSGQKPFIAPDSNLESPFNFPLVGGSEEPQLLPAIAPAPCPIKERRLQNQAIYATEKAKLVAEQERRDVDTRIDQLERRLHAGRPKTEEKLVLAERLQELREKKSQLARA